MTSTGNATAAPSPRAEAIAVRGPSSESKGREPPPGFEEAFPDLLQGLEAAPDASGDAAKAVSQPPARALFRFLEGVPESVHVAPGDGAAVDAAGGQAELALALEAGVAPLAPEIPEPGEKTLAASLIDASPADVPGDVMRDGPVAPDLKASPHVMEVLPAADRIAAAVAVTGGEPHQVDATIPKGAADDGNRGQGVVSTQAGNEAVPMAPALPSQKASFMLGSDVVRAVPVGANAAVQTHWNVVRRETHFAPLSTGLRDRIANITNPAPDVSTGMAELQSIMPSGMAAGKGAMAPAADPRIEMLQALSAGRSGAPESGVADFGSEAAPVHHQIFSRIIDELQGNGTASAASTPTSPVAQIWRDTVPQPLRTLEIALEPHDLGKVTVKLSIKNDVIRVELDFARSEAAGIADRDKDALMSMIKSAGYQVDTLAVRHLDGERAVPVLQQALDGQAASRDTGAIPQFGDMSSGGRSAQGQRRSDDGGGWDRGPGHGGAGSVAGVEQGGGGSRSSGGGGIYI